ncbi:STAS domain-containing protein [Amycolatopsis viridis]|uniref:Anti-sigma factor antagonist n=1 Tax=Amycolatopsis viridis TaxID=185678 RepID=A0ABX0T0F1_9PSEU|nr:STAS domain-containing protein [Amycolatopsis viridis]NIH81374.1 anti-sigma B factor antagonist [Amycolatopsis viridis]
MTSLKVEWTYRPWALVVTVTGEVDAGTISQLRDGIEAARAGAPVPPPAVVLDLTGVGFIGSSGLALLVEVSEECAAAGQELTLVCASRPVLRPLQLTGLDQVFTITGTLPPAP